MIHKYDIVSKKVPKKIREDEKYSCSNSMCRDIHCVDCIHCPPIVTSFPPEPDEDEDRYDERV